MSALTIAKQQATAIHLALQEAGHKVVASIDAEVVHSAVTDGLLAALVEVEETQFDTWDVSTHQLRYIVISPTLNVVDAWEELDALTEALREPLEIESARLTMWQPPTGQPYPALLLTQSMSEHD